MSEKKLEGEPKSWIKEATQAEEDASKSGARGEGMGLHAVLETLEDLDATGVEIKPVSESHPPAEIVHPTARVIGNPKDPKYKKHRTIDEAPIGHGFWEDDTELGGDVDAFERSLNQKK